MNINTQPTVASNSDLRKFGFIMGGMVALIFGLLFPWITDKTSHDWPIWPFIVLAVFWLTAIIAPKILRPIEQLWQKVGTVLGFINSRLILGLMFFALIFPIGLILKILRKDSMNRKLLKDVDTYRKNVIPRDKKHLEKPF